MLTGVLKRNSGRKVTPLTPPRSAESGDVVSSLGRAHPDAPRFAFFALPEEARL